MIVGVVVCASVALVCAFFLGVSRGEATARGAWQGSVKRAIQRERALRDLVASLERDLCAARAERDELGAAIERQAAPKRPRPKRKRAS